MSGHSFDANIVIDALLGYELAHRELKRISQQGERVWISRMTWIEVMSKGEGRALRDASYFLSGFGIDEIDEEIAARAASLRREKPRLKTPDAIILASAQMHDRVLVTRNTRDFPADMPGIRIPYTL